MKTIKSVSTLSSSDHQTDALGDFIQILQIHRLDL